MNALMFQTVLLLLLAFLGGCALGCWLRRIFAAQEVGVSIPVPPELLKEDADAPQEAEDTFAVAEEPSPETSEEPSPAPAADEEPKKADEKPVTAADAPEAGKAQPQPEESKTGEPGKTSPASSEDEGEIVAVETDGDLSGRQPKGLKSPRGGKADDLKKIKGIGKVNEGRLNSFGIWHFDQIAGWGDEEAEWVDNFLTFPGRIGREDWIGQAKKLAAQKD